MGSDDPTPKPADEEKVKANFIIPEGWLAALEKHFPCVPADSSFLGPSVEQIKHQRQDKDALIFDTSMIEDQSSLI